MNSDPTSADLLGSARRRLLRRALAPAFYRAQGWVHLLLWRLRGRPLPAPSAFKQLVVKSYVRRFAVRTVVETGTYLGVMVMALRQQCLHVYSIELSRTLAERAIDLFAGDSRVSILHGDSAAVLPDLMPHLESPCLFWLDAHYSGGVTAVGSKQTPIIEELSCVLRLGASGDVVLIDDARCFTPDFGYPTVETVRSFVAGRWPEAVFDVEDDIIRIHRPR